jgi:hypothetical protein
MITMELYPVTSRSLASPPRAVRNLAQQELNDFKRIVQHGTPSLTSTSSKRLLTSRKKVGNKVGGPLVQLREFAHFNAQVLRPDVRV